MPCDCEVLSSTEEAGAEYLGGYHLCTKVHSFHVAWALCQKALAACSSSQEPTLFGLCHAWKALARGTQSI